MGFLDEVIIDGAKLDADIAGRINKARSIRTMDGASTVELTLIDADRKLRESGILTRRGKPSKKGDFDGAYWNRFGEMRLTIGGRFYRLAGDSKAEGSDVIVLSFEDEIASIMRRFKGPHKASRNDMSRLDFVVQLAKRSRRYEIAVRAPEADVKQPIKGDTAHERSKAREKGLAHWKRLTVKGVGIDREQRRNLETGLAVCDEDQAGDRATLAWIVAVIQESTARNLTGGDASSVGILQLLSTWLGGSTSTHGGRRDVELVTHMFLTQGFFGKGGAKRLAADNPDWTLAQIAQAVQGSAFPDAYAQWEDEAHAILEAWGGVGEVRVERRRYEYIVHGENKETGEQAETYWDASGRLLVDEVKFRRFATENVLWLVSDEWLFKRMPTFLIEESPDVQVGYDAHVGVPLAEVRVTAMKPSFTGRPGNTVEVAEREGAIAGKWLLQSIDEDLFELDPANLILRRPVKSLPEPEANKDKIVLTESPAEAGSVQRAIVDAAKLAMSRKELYRYGQRRPMPSGLFEGATHIRGPGGGHDEPVVIDCSAFVILCYKAAGAPDPTGRGYDGYGYTRTLWANGKRTNDPQPGDLAFYGDPTDTTGHVNVYIGNGESINMGGHSVTRGNTRTGFRSDFLAFRTYNVG
jgi:hypothetical protein